jgi:hypothetical protein
MRQAPPPRPGWRTSQRVRAGDFADVEKKIGRVIHYLLQASFRTGGMVVLETVCDEQHGGRAVRGAALRT